MPSGNKIRVVKGRLEEAASFIDGAAPYISGQPVPYPDYWSYLENQIAGSLKSVTGDMSKGDFEGILKSFCEERFAKQEAAIANFKKQLAEHHVIPNGWEIG